MAQDVFGIVGSVIAGAYQVQAVVAEGGFAVVYRAFHTGFSAPVALKCLKIPEQFSQKQKQEFLDQFRAEAVLLFKLSASIPTVVRPLHVDAFTTEAGVFVPFTALEWLDGETLDAIVARRMLDRRPPFTLKRLVKMLTPVARALERAHNFVGAEGRISIVHRDLKPENIFVATVAGEQVIKILDFGIGKAKSVASQVAGRASQTSSGLASFTPAYGAPEQWVPKRFGQTGPWTDVWGLALTFIEVLTQRPAIDGDHAEIMAIALDPKRRPTPRKLGADVSDEVEAVFARALAVDPRQRYSDAGEFWNDLIEAAGVDVEPDGRLALGPRDARAEGRAVPRIEHIEAALRISSMAPKRSDRALVSTSSIGEQPTMLDVAVPPADAANASETPHLPTSASEPLEIPDLTLGPMQPLQSERLPASLGPRDLEIDGPPGAIDIALDLAPDERPLARPSGSSLRAVELVGAPSGNPPEGRRPQIGPSLTPLSRPGSDTSRSDASAVAVTGVRARQSGGYTAVGGDEYAALGAPPPAATPAAGASSMSPFSSGRPDARASLRAVLEPRSIPTKIPSLLKRLLPGLFLVAVSVAITIVDQIVAASTGEVLTVAGIRSTYIAGLFMMAGVALAVYRLLPRA